MTSIHALPLPAQPDPQIPSIAFPYSDELRDTAAERLAEAVRIATVSYDDTGPMDEDPRWSVFYDFHKWLTSTYDTVFKHETVDLTIVNKLALLTTVKGTDPALKPLLLLSHYDVVPADAGTSARWTYPPFAGVIDTERRFIHGRGASDCKDLLTAQYEALTLLLKAGFRPRRTVILAHGQDEETSGQQGARKLAAHLEGIYGKDSMLMILDEGIGSMRFFGRAFGLACTTEKGYLDVQVSVATKGGHSAFPPQHTGIGIAAEIIQAIEEHSRDDALAPRFAGPSDPMLQFQALASKYAPGYPPQWSKLLETQDWTTLAAQFAQMMPEARPLMSTTTAVDVIKGGVKANALPELVTFVINHRLAISASDDVVKEHLIKVVTPVAEKHGLVVHAFNEGSPSFQGQGNVQLTKKGFGLPPAPHAPTNGPVWDMFAGTARHVLKDAQNGNEPYIITPFAMIANTDTASYWNLTKSIFRYPGGPAEDYAYNIHTVDERVSLESHVKTIEWIHAIIQNADALED